VVFVSATNPSQGAIDDGDNDSATRTGDDAHLWSAGAARTAAGAPRTIAHGIPLPAPPFCTAFDERR
jgi:hypothetical protein